MTEHAKKVEQLNWSWAIHIEPFPLWKISDLTENFTDIDSMSINAAKAEAANQLKPDQYLHLEHFVIDLQNNLAYKKNKGFETIFKVVKTGSNNRGRSRLTNRKSFDSAAVFQAAKHSFFAKEQGEYAKMWYEKNDKKQPTVRQILVGIWQFYTSQMHKDASANEQGSLQATLATY